MHPSISLCLIVRDEEPTLGRCRASLEGGYDELIVVDTGSQDGSIDIARSFGARETYRSLSDAAAANSNLEEAIHWIRIALGCPADELGMYWSSMSSRPALLSRLAELYRGAGQEEAAKQCESQALKQLEGQGQTRFSASTAWFKAPRGRHGPSQGLGMEAMLEAPTSSRMADADSHTALLSLDLPEGSLEIEVPVPQGPERLVDFAAKMLPLCDVAADMAAQEALRLGRPVSCAKGCGACCRQLVPLSPPEAGIIFEHVRSLPEVHREVITNRFQMALERLERGGLRTELKAVSMDLVHEEISESLALRYFSLQIPCPFLEEETCGIYSIRPSMCREYQVVSAAKHCLQPYAGGVVRLPLSFRLSEALMQIWAQVSQGSVRVVPLVTAWQWSRDNPEHRELTASGRDLLANLLGRISDLVAAREASASGPGGLPQSTALARTKS